MNCKLFDDFLDHYLDGLMDAELTMVIDAHIADCGRCRKLRDQARTLQSQLANLNAPSVDRGLYERVWQPVRERKAKPAGRRRWIAPGLAAGFMLAILLVAVVPDPSSKVPTVELVLLEEKNLQLVFTSEEEVDGATFFIELPAQVKFAGHPERQQVSWNANLKQGKNLLRLPVVADGEVDDLMTARIRTAKWEQVFELRLSTSSST
ncbi:anti-sigma factor family protein [Microbulbifer sp. JSM ZJ756]|uniref:anti-sigma factor family protein n=1 Tax=Microbulbifer sp. JSM ZJ756 TaxID=3376191 RepID=UPI0037B9BBCE